MYSAWATYTSGDMLMNSAKAKKKKSYEYLSLACFGPQGKFSVEFAQIGLMLGTCIGKGYLFICYENKYQQKS